MKTMRSAIYGAGSLGTVMGAYLTKNGVDIDLVNRNRAHVEALKANGARITGTVDMTVPVHALLPEEMSGTYDVIFLMTKQLNNRETVTFLKDYLADDGVTNRDNELYLIETGFAKGWIQPRIPAVRTDQTIAVVGSGPAGLACADLLNQMGHSVTVIELHAVHKSVQGFSRNSEKLCCGDSRIFIQDRQPRTIDVQTVHIDHPVGNVLIQADEGTVQGKILKDILRQEIDRPQAE